MLSIIVKVYNEEKYIENCLMSLIDEIDDSDEIIVIDDGSSDKSKEIVESFIAKYSKKNVKIISKKNGGPGSALNKGLEEACNQYIQIVDGDDSLAEGSVKRIKNVLSNNPVDLLVFDIETIKLNGEKERTSHSYPKNIVIEDINVAECLSSVPSATNKVISKNLIEKVNETFLEIMIGEDLNAISKLYPNVETMIYDDSVLYNYIEREGSLITNVESLERNLDIITAIDDLVSYYSRNEFLEEYSEPIYSLVFNHLLIFTTVRLLKNSKDSKAEGVRMCKEIKESFIQRDKEINLSKGIKHKIQRSNLKHYLIYTLIKMDAYSILYKLV